MSSTSLSNQSLYSLPGFGMYGQAPYNPQQFSGPSIQGTAFQVADPNSPDGFKQNLQLAQQHVARIQSLARSALAGIENAYHPGTSAAQTASDITALNQTLDMFSEFLRQTGLGALPLEVNVGNTGLNRVQKMREDTTRGIQVHYDRLRRSQESAGVVASLLSAQDQASKR